jgi:hypothetical protein
VVSKRLTLPTPELPKNSLLNAQGVSVGSEGEESQAGIAAMSKEITQTAKTHREI